MSDATKRAEIHQYVQKAFLAKIMQMNDIRQDKMLELRSELGRHGHSLNSSAWVIGEVEIEEDCIANLLRQKGGLYIEAYGRVGLRIGPDVLRDLAHSQVELTTVRKNSLAGGAQLTAGRTNQHQNTTMYGHLGKKASVAMKEVEASIDLYNLSHPTHAANGPLEPIASAHPDANDNNQKSGGESKELETPKITEPPRQRTIWSKMWSWGAVSVLDSLILAGWMTFMTSGHPKAADGFLFVGAVLFLAKFWTWEEARLPSTPKKWALQSSVTLITFGLVLLAARWNHAINRSGTTSGSEPPAAAGTEAEGKGTTRDSGGDGPTESKSGEQSGKAASTAASGRTISVAERVKIIIARHLLTKAAEDLKPGDDFEADLGADPADVYFLMSSLEEEYGITIPPSDSRNLHTVGETISYIEKKVQHKQEVENQQKEENKQKEEERRSAATTQQTTNPLTQNTPTMEEAAPSAERVVTIADRVKMIIARQLYLPPSRHLKPEDDFEMDLGATPTQVGLIVYDLQEEYKIKIPDSDAKKIKTVGEAIAYIEKEEK
jgi:acyl carrier protein